MPSRPSARGDRPLRAEAEGQARALDPLALGADHLAVAVEGVEVGGDRGRVGADPVRRPPRRRLADLVGELEQALDQRLLARLQRDARRLGVGPGGGLLPGRAGFAQDAGDPRVGVLDVVDRVVAGLAAGQVEVEVDGRLVAAPEHEPAGRVDADVVEQLVERDEVAAALRHLRPLAGFDDVDEAHDQRLEGVGVGAERLDRGPHPAT